MSHKISFATHMAFGGSTEPYFDFGLVNSTSAVEAKTPLRGVVFDRVCFLFRNFECCASLTLVWHTTQSFLTKSMGRVFSIQRLS